MFLIVLFINFISIFASDNIFYVLVMKNVLLFFSLLACVASSCEGGMEGEPVITIDSIQVNHETFPGYEIYSIPVNAEVRVFATLEASDGTLKSFNTEVNCGEDDAQAYQKDIKYEEEVVSNNGMADPSEGTLRFKDGVIKTRVEVETVAPQAENHVLTFKFYLNADERAAKEELRFRVTEEDK